MNGEDLGKVLAAARAMSAPIALDCALTIVTGACVAVHQAHEAMRAGAGTYGDLGPQRIRVGFEGQVQLVAGAGDVRCRAPEQSGGRTDRRTDVYALGVLLYEATTGRAPGPEPGRPSLVVPGYPPALESIVMRALAREPGRRQPTALELQRQLEGYAREHRCRLSPAGVAQLMSGLFPGRRAEPDNIPSYVPHPLPAFDDSDVIDTGDTSHDLPSQDRTGQRKVASPHHALPATMKLPAVSSIPPLPRVPSSSSPPLTTMPLPGVKSGLGSLPRASSPVLRFDEPTAQVRSLAEIERSSAASLAETSAWTPAMEAPTVAAMLPLPAPPHSVDLALGTEPPEAHMARSRPAMSMSTAPKRESYGPPEMPRAPSSPPVPRAPAAAAPELPPVRSTPPEMRSPSTSPEAPAFAPATPGARMSSSMPVPGVPGAVPIVKPPMMSMVPAGGTLVSSAVLAGNSPPSAHGPSSLSGELVGRAGQNFAQGAYQPPPAHQGFPSTLPGVGVAPVYAPEPLVPPVAAVPVMSAPKTLMLHRRRSPLPLIAAAVVGLAGAFTAVWFGVLRGGDAAAPAATAPAAAPVSNKRHADEAPEPAPAPVEAAPAAAPTPTPEAAAPTPTPTAAAPTPSPEAATPVAAPAPEVAPPAAAPPPQPVPPPKPSAEAAIAPPTPPSPRPNEGRPATTNDDISTERPAKLGADPARKKQPAKVHADKHRKSESKENSWSDDSPFMPVATPKH